MRTLVLTICAVLGLQAAPVWASTTPGDPPAAPEPGPTRTRLSLAKPSGSSTNGAGSAAERSAPAGQAGTASGYAAREASHPELRQFKGGGSSSIYIGGSTVVIILLVVLLIVLL